MGKAKRNRKIRAEARRLADLAGRADVKRIARRLRRNRYHDLKRP